MNVLELNNNNIEKFDYNIKKNCIILFHHHQCGHCRDLRPTWEKVKKMNQTKPINIMEIDAEMIDKINHPVKKTIRGFPQIVRLENGKVMEEFDQIRNVENLNEFINKNIDYSLNTNEQKELKKPKKTKKTKKLKKTKKKPKKIKKLKKTKKQL